MHEISKRASRGNLSEIKSRPYTSNFAYSYQNDSPEFTSAVETIVKKNIKI